MATVEALQRLQGLVQRLLPLSDARAGEPVRAEDWNTLVVALMDVARVALAEAGAIRAVPPHDHPDQVKLSWLDPALREALSRGGLGGPAAVTRAGREGLDLDRLRKRFEDVGAEVVTLRDWLAATANRDLVREADFSSCSAMSARCRAAAPTTCCCCAVSSKASRTMSSARSAQRTG